MTLGPKGIANLRLLPTDSLIAGNVLSVPENDMDAEAVTQASAPNGAFATDTAIDAEPTAFSEAVSWQELGAIVKLADPDPDVINCPLALAKLMVNDAVPMPGIPGVPVAAADTDMTVS